MHMQPMALIQPNVTPRYLPGMSHRQDPPREIPKALLLLAFFKILPNFILVEKILEQNCKSSVCNYDISNVVIVNFRVPVVF